MCLNPDIHNIYIINPRFMTQPNNMSAFKAILLLTLITLVFNTSQYKATVVNTNTSTISIYLSYFGNDTYYLKPTSPIIKNLLFTIHCHTINDITFKIIDASNKRFEVPQYGVFPIDPYANFSFPLNLSQFVFTYTANPFDFRITRRSTNQTIFDTYGGHIVFSDHYLQISTSTASKTAYGFGERFSPRFRLDTGKYTIFNRDRGQVIDRAEGLQTYGYYPVYLLREQAGFFHINYFRSSNAMDVIVTNKSANAYAFTYKAIGGVFDFRIFLGEKSPESILQKFQTYIGRSTVPPFWSLGFHQCRWGYKDIDALEAVLKGYEQNDIPLDTIWSDIDYMIEYQDFTIDQTRFPLDRMSNITTKYHYVPIIDAGIKVNDGFAYKEGVKRNVFLKDADRDEYRGSVWPGTTTFVDFFSSNASKYWQDMLSSLYQKVKFSGIWLDMNQIANFCDGPCSPPKSLGFDYSKDLPYNPGSDSIEAHTISLNATHVGGILEADVHVYFGFLESQATNQFLASKGLRPFIISRSSTLGSNKYAFHWTGDNYAAFEYLKSSISHNFMFQLWGIQMVGPDICGFGGNTTQQLCSRWFQIGALYPFARNHNDYFGISQEAFALGPTVMNASRTNLKLRYSILKFYYRHFLNKRGFGTIFRPLFFDFPQDINVYQDEIADTQFTIGMELMGAPVLDPNTTTRSVYFPQVAWYDFQSGDRHQAGSKANISNALTDPVPLFIREGTGLLINSVENVTMTSHLSSTFQLRAGLAYDSNRSTPSAKHYAGLVGALSIQDYNDESSVSSCLTQGCQYTLQLQLALGQSFGQLELDVVYVGGRGLNQQITIDSLRLYYEKGVIEQKLQTPVRFSGTTRVKIPIESSIVA